MIIRANDFSYIVNFDNTASLHIDDVTGNERYNPKKLPSMFAVNVVWFNRKEGFTIYMDESLENAQDVCREITKAYRKRRREVVIEVNAF